MPPLVFTRALKFGLQEGLLWQAHEFMRRIGTVFRVKDDDLIHEPLPERWVDLIHYLDEKERRAARQHREKNALN